MVAKKRKDLGKPIDGFFKKQPQPRRVIVDTLRRSPGEAGARLAEDGREALITPEAG
jgi:hypothetical protein